MEHLFYLTVKGLSTIYWLYKTFRFLFGEQGKNLWHFFTPGEREKKETPQLQARPEDVAGSVVGKSQTVYLTEPLKEKPVEPAFSEDLQRIPAYREEPDVTADEVDYNPDAEVLTEEERFTPLDIEPDSVASSTGMTYEQIYGALDVVQGKKTGDADKLSAARLLYDVQGSEVFSFLEAQAVNEAMIERLLKENLDDAGVILPETGRKKRCKIEEFDMEKYV